MIAGAQCVPCYREGKILKLGTPLNGKPPFALAVVNGETVCIEHLAAAAPPEFVYVPDPPMRRKWWR